LAAARTVFGEVGYSASVHQICRAAGVGIGTFYHQFPDKANLMRQLMSQEHAFRVHAFDAIAAAHTDSVAGEVARVIGGSDPALLRAMIEAYGVDPQLRDFGRDLRRETQERLAAAFGRVRQARGIRPALDAGAAASATLVLGDTEIGRAAGPEIRKIIDVLVFAEGDDGVHVRKPA
jgi:AcrR family transcriptional regulator